MLTTNNRPTSAVLLGGDASDSSGGAESRPITGLGSAFVERV
jgi:hypothetical protein